jgi:release factor glutamine methyltransferase
MTIQQLLTKSYEELKSVEIESYIIDCQLLLGKVLNLDRMAILTNKEMKLSESNIVDYMKLIELRKRKMPVKYLLGICEFMSMDFIIREGVLIPRPDTEVLVQEVIKAIEKYDYKDICDVCSGSGIIGISIANYTKVTNVISYDISPVAYEVTKENITNFNLSSRVKVKQGDLLSEAIESGKTFDVVVSNPPYIKEIEIETLMEDVKQYEPHIALNGGKDGLDFYREIAKQSYVVLNAGGMLAFEIGFDQKYEVSEILLQNGYEGHYGIKDLSGKDRVLIAFKSKNNL